MKISTRLFLQMTVAVIGFIAIFAANFLVSHQIAAMSEVRDACLSANSKLKSLDSATKDLLISGYFGDSLAAWKSLYAECDKGIVDIASSSALSSLLSSKEEKASVKQLADLWALGKDNLQMVQDSADAVSEENPLLMIYRGILGKSLDDTSRGETKLLNNANMSIEYFRTTFDTAFEKLYGLLDGKIRFRTDMLTLLGIGITAAFSALIIVMLVLFSVSLRRGLALLKSAMEKYGSGDLSVPARAVSRDEFGEILARLDAMILGFSDIIGRIKTAADQAKLLEEESARAFLDSSAGTAGMAADIESISAQSERLMAVISKSIEATGSISSGIRRVSGDLDRQAASISQTSSSSEEMSASIRSVSEVSGKRETAAQDLKDMAEREARRFDALSAMISENASDIERINEIMEIIDAISEQINILAMNAAIEAAHAGEAGKGFAVVSDEIRRLAESTNENSKMIRQTVSAVSERIVGISAESAESRKAYERIREETETSSRSMAEISRAMAELAKASAEMADTMAEMRRTAEAIREESRKIAGNTAEVDGAMASMEALGKEFASRSDKLDEEAKRLQSYAAGVRESNSRNSKAVAELKDMITAFK